MRQFLSFIAIVIIWVIAILVFSLAKQIAASQSSFMPFLIAGVFYFVANYLVEFVMTRVEKSMDYYK